MGAACRVVVKEKDTPVAGCTAFSLGKRQPSTGTLTAYPSIKPSVNWSNIEKKEVRVTDQFTLGFNDG